MVDLVSLNPLSRMDRMEPMDSDKKYTAVNTDKASFLDVFKSIYDNVVETNEQVDRDAIDVMLGNIDDLATVQANIEKANTAVDMLVTVKNEVLSAYSTIINMQV